MNRLAVIVIAALFLVVPGAPGQDRIEYNGQALFLSGANLAWQNFADDIGPNPATPDTNHFAAVFEQIHASGGNSLRLWLHTTGANTPAWNASIVTGPGLDTIADLRTILDLAWERKVGLILCLWSFDMLRISNGGTITTRARDILTNEIFRGMYVTNALIPMVQALKDHPGIIAWEIFNEPEGMSDEFGWSFNDHVPMSAIQAFINQCAGAIHRADPKAKVSNGSWSFYAATDVGAGNQNYYTDARLIAAGGDPDGVLDFYMVHYYDWAGTQRSPFQHPASYWALDKPLVVAEFYPPPACVNCGSGPYENLYQSGYAGALAWSWTDSDPAAILAQMIALANAHPVDVLIGSTNGVLELGVTPPTGTSLLAGMTNAIAVRVTDLYPITTATVTGALSTGGTLDFLDNGVPPDLSPGDANYAASLVVPAGLDEVTLTLAAAAPGKTGVTNLIVYPIVPVQPNDFFTNAAKIANGGGRFTGANNFSTREAGEPFHAGTAGARSLWWRWSPTASGPVLIDTAGSSFDTVLAVYTGSHFPALTNIAAVDDVPTPSGLRRQGYVSFNAVGGTSYRIAVAGYSESQSGKIRLRVEPNGAPETNAPAVFIASPLSGTVVSTDQILVSGTANDPGLNASGMGRVQVRVGSRTSSAAGTTNWSASVRLSPGPNLIEAQALDVAGNLSAPANITVTCSPPAVGNDHFVNAAALTAAGGVNATNTTLASREFGEPNHAGNAGGRSVWWKFTAPADGVLSLSTSNSTFDTLLGLYTGTAVGSLTTVAGNDDVPGGGRFSELTQAVSGGQIYRIAVDGYAGASGIAQLDYSFTAGPVYALTITHTAGGSVAPSSGLFVGGATVVLTAAPDPGYGFGGWTGSISSTNNPWSFVVGSNLALTASFSWLPHTDGFESGNLQALPWVPGGDAPWIVQSTRVSSGAFAARSGLIGDGQVSSLILSRDFQSGTGAFDACVSSELNWDRLEFYADGILQQQWSGEAGWTRCSFLLAAGSHTLEWRYQKDPSLAGGLDAAFLDNVDLPIGMPTPSHPPARLSLRLLPDRNGVVELTGQTNQTYIVQTSADLTRWQSISTNLAVGGVVQVPVTNPGSTRFYRAFVPDP
jgi:hypothetical protein